MKLLLFLATLFSLAAASCSAGVLSLQDIPDDDCASLITEEFSVLGPGTVQTVALRVLVEHSWRGDVDVALVSPSGTSVILGQTEDDGDDNINVIFMDGGGELNFVGDDNLLPEDARIVDPENPLSSFQDESAQGVWRLTFCDDFVGDVGTIIEAQLFISTNSTLDVSTLANMGTCFLGNGMRFPRGQCDAIINEFPPIQRRSEGCAVQIANVTLDGTAFVVTGVDRFNAGCTGGGGSFVVHQISPQGSNISALASSFAIFGSSATVINPYNFSLVWSNTLSNGSLFDVGSAVPELHSIWRANCPASFLPLSDFYSVQQVASASAPGVAFPPAVSDYVCVHADFLSLTESSNGVDTRVSVAGSLSLRTRQDLLGGFFATNLTTTDTVYGVYLNEAIPCGEGCVSCDLRVGICLDFCGPFGCAVVDGNGDYTCNCNSSIATGPTCRFPSDGYLMREGNDNLLHDCCDADKTVRGCKDEAIERQVCQANFACCNDEWGEQCRQLVDLFSTCDAVPHIDSVRPEGLMDPLVATTVSVFGRNFQAFSPLLQADTFYQCVFTEVCEYDLCDGGEGFEHVVLGSLVVDPESADVGGKQVIVCELPAWAGQGSGRGRAISVQVQLGSLFVLGTSNNFIGRFPSFGEVTLSYADFCERNEGNIPNALIPGERRCGLSDSVQDRTITCPTGYKIVSLTATWGEDFSDCCSAPAAGSCFIDVTLNGTLDHCINQTRCDLSTANTTFLRDNVCPGVERLHAQATCSFTCDNCQLWEYCAAENTCRNRPMPNDQCENAAELSFPTTQVTGWLSAATFDAELFSNPVVTPPRGAGVWYTFETPNDDDDLIEIDFCGAAPSNISGAINVYRSDSCAGIAEADALWAGAYAGGAANCSGLGTRVVFRNSDDNRFYIHVSPQFAFPFGFFIFNLGNSAIRRAENDRCVEASPIFLSNFGATPGTTIGSPVQNFGNQLCVSNCGRYDCSTHRHAVWYSVDGNGRDIQVAVRNTNADPFAQHTVHVYEGVCGNLRCVTGSRRNDVTSWRSNDDTLYYVVVSSVEGRSGSFELDVVSMGVDGPIFSEDFEGAFAPALPNPWKSIDRLYGRVGFGGDAQQLTPIFEKRRHRAFEIPAIRPFQEGRVLPNLPSAADEPVTMRQQETWVTRVLEGTSAVFTPTQSFRQDVVLKTQFVYSQPLDTVTLDFSLDLSFGSRSADENVFMIVLRPIDATIPTILYQTTSDVSGDFSLDVSEQMRFLPDGPIQLEIRFAAGEGTGGSVSLNSMAISNMVTRRDYFF